MCTVCNSERASHNFALIMVLSFGSAVSKDNIRTELQRSSITANKYYYGLLNLLEPSGNFTYRKV
jgi:hypothetical protein